MIISLYPQDSGNMSSWLLGNFNFQVFRELQSSDIIGRYIEKSDQRWHRVGEGSKIWHFGGDVIFEWPPMQICILLVLRPWNLEMEIALKTIKQMR